MDIQTMLKALIDKGLTQQQIAIEIDVEQPTVSRMLKGAEPSYPKGKRIEKLYLSQIGANDPNMH